MKIYDLSQDLNQDASFWPFYPPFEVKYIKRKSEQGVNAQYIQTSNHMGTHLDAPRHFVTNGKTIDQIPCEWRVARRAASHPDARHRVEGHARSGRRQKRTCKRRPRAEALPSQVLDHRAEAEPEPYP
jgi:hypothetical protein